MEPNVQTPAGENAALSVALSKLDGLMREYGNTPVVGPGRTSTVVMAEARALLVGAFATAVEPVATSVVQHVSMFDFDEWFNEHSQGAQLHYGLSLRDFESALQKHIAQAVAAVQCGHETAESFDDMCANPSNEGGVPHTVRYVDGESEPVARVDEGDDGMFAVILPDVSVEVGQLLYSAPPSTVHAYTRGRQDAIEAYKNLVTPSAEQKWSGDEIARACVQAGLGVLECNSLMVTLKSAPTVARKLKDAEKESIRHAGELRTIYAAVSAEGGA